MGLLPPQPQLQVQPQATQLLSVFPPQSDAQFEQQQQEPTPSFSPAVQVLYDALAALDNDTAIRVVTDTMKSKPELAPVVVNYCVPDLTYAPADALGKRRAVGVIKSWDKNGYGFIACPELKAVFGNDVYVHKNQIRDFGPGAEVTFAVLLSKDMKPQAFDIQSSGGPGCCCGGGYGKALGKGGCALWGAGGPAARPPRQLSDMAKPDVQQVLGQFIGIIKSFNAKNGFGFIRCEDLIAQGYANDVYMHHTQVKDFQPGNTVRFTAYLNKKGQPQCMDLQELSPDEQAMLAPPPLA